MSNRPLLYKYKGNSCSYCGKTVDEMLRAFQTMACFQLHHIDPSKKSPEYENLIRRKLSSEQLDEVDKCALLCGNCHSTLHGQNITLDVNVQLHAGGTQPIEHTLKCQVVCDFKKQEATLLSDEFEFLDLYRVRIGNAAPEVNSGLQLKELKRLDELIEVSRTGRMALVETLDGILMFSATRLSDEECEVEVNVDFPLCAAQLSFKTPDGRQSLNMFARKGHIIMDSEKSYIMGTYGSGRLTVIIRYAAREEVEKVSAE